MLVLADEELEGRRKASPQFQAAQRACAKDFPGGSPP
jgi:hypothetical protein